MRGVASGALGSAPRSSKTQRVSELKKGSGIGLLRSQCTKNTGMAASLSIDLVQPPKISWRSGPVL